MEIKAQKENMERRAVKVREANTESEDIEDQKEKLARKESMEFKV